MANTRVDPPTTISYLLGVVLVIQGLLLFHALIEVFPAAVEADRPPGATRLEPCVAGSLGIAPVPSPSPTAPAGARHLPVRFLGGEICWSVSSDSTPLLLVIVAGALGALVHATASYAKHMAYRTFTSSYNWWYALRLLVGAGLAVIFYYVVRGGLLSIAADDTQPNIYGITALAALVGLFSYPAMKRLEVVFERLATGGETRGSENTPPKPAITGVTPRSLTVGTDDRIVAITGTGFGDEAIVEVDGRERTAAPEGAGKLRVTLDEADVAASGKLSLRVRAGKTWSEPYEITVRSPGRPRSSDVIK